MSNRIPWAEYAVQKVTKFVPACRQKGTLIAIAAHLNYERGVAWPKIETIAQESGNSIPTVKRHIKELEQLGHLLVQRPTKHEHRPNYYRIPCCAFSVAELEFITGIGGDQLVLGIIEPDTIGSGVTIGPENMTVAERQWVSGRYPMGISMIPDGYQDDTLTVRNNPDKKDSAQLLLEKGVVTRSQVRDRQLLEEALKRTTLSDEDRVRIRGRLADMGVPI